MSVEPVRHRADHGRVDGGLDSRVAQAIRSTFLVILGLMAEDLARQQRPGDRSQFRAVSAAQFPRVHKLASVALGTDQWKFLIDALVAGIETQMVSPGRKGRLARA